MAGHFELAVGKEEASLVANGLEGLRAQRKYHRIVVGVYFMILSIIDCDALAIQYACPRTVDFLHDRRVNHVNIKKKRCIDGAAGQPGPELLLVVRIHEIVEQSERDRQDKKYNEGKLQCETSPYLHDQAVCFIT